METQQMPQQSESDVHVGNGMASDAQLENEAPLFDRYVVKIDLAVSAGAVPTGGWPTGF
jgi:hypothetical protein